MKKSFYVLLLVALLLALIPAGMVQAKKPLQAASEHHFVGAPDGDRFIFWEGIVYGDIEGDIVWFGDPTTMRGAGQTNHYAMFWEITDGDGNVLLAGEDQAGTTTARHGKNSNWRTNGTVTVANGDYAEWLGRHVHMSGHFTWIMVDGEPVPFEGVSILRIN